MTRRTGFDPELEGALDAFEAYMQKTNGHCKHIPDYIEGVRKAAKVCHDLFGACGAHKHFFTCHGPGHSARVMQYALEIAELSRSYKNPLSPRGLYLLGLCTFLHDLGMTEEQLPPDIAKECPTEHDRITAIRKRHPEALSDVLEKKRGLFSEIRSLEEEVFDQYLYLVSVSHSTGHYRNGIDELNRIKKRCPDINLAIVASILMFADEMDLDHRRTPSHFLKEYESFCDQTKAHWCKHWLVEKVFREGNVIKVIHASDGLFPGCQHFREWTEAKLKGQLCSDPELCTTLD